MESFPTFFNSLCSRLVGVPYLLILIPLLSIAAPASSPAQYQDRINSARSGIEKLVLSSDHDPAAEHETLAEVEGLIPETEEVKWPGGTIETDNRWLGTRLADLRETNDKQTRVAILAEIAERFEAISTAAGGLIQSGDPGRSKDQDKQKLAEILRRPEYQKPAAPAPSIFQKWLDEVVDWLSKFFPRPEISPGTPSEMGTLKIGLQVLIFAIVIGLVGFLFYRFAPFIHGQFRSVGKDGKNPRVIFGERIGDDVSASDLFEEAESLARSGNLREAIRKGYIALLCELSDRELIRLARHKTNRDYLRDLRKNDGLYRTMSGLTRSFEVNWYGLNSAEQTDWEEFRDGYQQTVASVRR